MLCDKCGQEVPPENDATIIQAIATGSYIIAFVARPRHFLPVKGCEGSPSRSQYIEGQPRDTRGYPYLFIYEGIWRDAYKKAQEKSNV